MRTPIFSSVVLCLLFGCSTIHGLAQEKPDVAKIRELESKWTDAYKHRHIAGLASLLADDFVITTEDGRTYGKVGFLSYNSGALRVDVAEMSDLKIRIHGDTAVVTGSYHERGEANGTQYDYHDRLTDVWMKIGGNWQLIASHYSLPVRG